MAAGGGATATGAATAGAGAAVATGAAGAGAGTGAAIGAAAGSLSGAGAATAAEPAASMTAIGPSLGIVWPSPARICVNVPSNGDGTSAFTLSVTISTIGSPTSTWSPTCFSHLPMVPSATLSPSWGM